MIQKPPHFKNAVVFFSQVCYNSLNTIYSAIVIKCFCFTEMITARVSLY